MNLDEQVAVVTGGASGIGRAGAQLMAQAGASVVVADLNESQAQEVARGITQSTGRRAIAHRTDVTDVASVRSLVDAAASQFGKIDVLFHNAMNVALVNRQDRRATELPEEIWDRIIQLVLTGTFLCAKYVGRQMLKQKSGSIIFTATVDALIGAAGIDAYTAAKGGVVAMTRSLAAGLAPDGIRVNAICPSFVETPQQMHFLNDPAERAKIQAMHLLPIAKPAQVAALAVFLASAESSAMTGGIYPVDGGYSAFKSGAWLAQALHRTDPASDEPRI